MELEILKQVAQGGGGIVVCFAMTLIFLRHIKEVHTDSRVKLEESIQRLTDSHMQEVRSTREAFETQLKSMHDRLFGVVDKVSEALTELKEAVKDLQHRLHDDGGPHA